MEQTEFESKARQLLGAAQAKKLISNAYRRGPKEFVFSVPEVAEFHGQLVMAGESIYSLRLTKDTGEVILTKLQQDRPPDPNRVVAVL